MKRDDYQPHSVKSELLPCPFCGEKLVEKDDHHGTWMAHRNETGDCEASVSQIMTEEDAKRWNTRATSNGVLAHDAAIREAGLREALEWLVAHCEGMIRNEGVMTRIGSKLEMDKAKQALSAPAASRGWRAIETAPKDGTAIMVILPLSDIPAIVRWDSGEGMAYGPTWVICWDGTHVSKFDQPVHWQPLPLGPEDGRGEG